MDHPPSLAVIGNFDGVHRGHQALLAAARAQADAAGLALLAITFEPHPRAYFTPASAPARLTDPAQKQELLQHYGADRVATLTFDAALANLGAEDFIARLHDDLNVRQTMVSPHFTFGKGRSGNTETLIQYFGRENVHLLDLVTDKDQPISSTRIRDLLAAGDTDGAAALLGHS